MTNQTPQIAAATQRPQDHEDPAPMSSARSPWPRSSRKKQPYPKSARWSPASTTTAWTRTSPSTPTPASSTPNFWPEPTRARCITPTCSFTLPYNTYRNAGLPPGPDRQSRTQRPRSRHASRPKRLLLLRRRCPGPPPLRPHHRRAQQECRRLSPGDARTVVGSLILNRKPEVESRKPPLPFAPSIPAKSTPPPSDPPPYRVSRSRDRSRAANGWLRRK